MPIMIHVGPHVTRDWVGGDIVDNIKAALDTCRMYTIKTTPDVCQIFVAGPRSTRIMVKKEDEENLARLGRNGTKIYAHGTYLDFPWTGVRSRATFIQRELNICDNSGIKGLVIHTSNRVTAEETARIAADIVAGEPRRTILFLEVNHSKAHYFSTAEGMADLISKITPGIGICVDIGHLWSSGVDLASYEQAAAWIRESNIGQMPSRRVLFHFNDSVSKFGSGTDKHAELMRGLIWRGKSAKASGLACFTKYAKKNNIPVILERKPKDLLESDYKVLDRILSK